MSVGLPNPDRQAINNKQTSKHTNIQTNGRTDATKHIISPASQSINILIADTSMTVNKEDYNSVSKASSDDVMNESKSL